MRVNFLNKIISLISRIIVDIKKYHDQHKIIINYFFALIGFVVIIWFLYLRVIREPLPRDIPFHLTELWFYLLIGLCLVHLYSIKSIIFTSTPKPIVIKFINYLRHILTPFILLDNFIKTNKIIFPYTLRLIKYIQYPEKGLNRRIYLFIITIIPRIILVIVFIIDIFWFNKLYYFYKCLPMGLLPLIYYYHKYSMYHLKEIGIHYLESIYRYDYVDVHEIGWEQPSVRYEDDEFGQTREIPIEPAWQPHPRNKYHFEIVSIRKYVQIILEKDIDETENDYEDSYELDPNPMIRQHIREEYLKSHNKIKCDLEDLDNLDRTFKILIPFITRLNIMLYYLPQKEKQKYIFFLKIVISFSYLIGWVYILITSIPTINGLPITMEILKMLTEHIIENNPFSE